MRCGGDTTNFSEWSILTTLRPQNSGRFGVSTDADPQYRWEIVVQPVPRVNRHRINKYILESALPQLSNWLSERTGLSQRGSDLLTFFYDEKSEQFESRPLSRLEPLRRR